MSLRKLLVPLVLQGAALMSLSAQEGPKVKPGKVLIVGENPFIELKHEAKGPVLTNVSFWRVMASPAGSGHACYVKSDLKGDGATKDDVMTVYTDNPKLVDYLNKEIMGTFNKNYGAGYTQKHATFARKGDTNAVYSEVITAGKDKVELVWKEIQPSFPIEIAVGGVTIMTTILPAKVAEVHINGQKAAGKVHPRPEGTATGSDGSLAWAETWVK